jgi:hypothetical protein
MGLDRQWSRPRYMGCFEHSSPKYFKVKKTRLYFHPSDLKTACNVVGYTFVDDSDLIQSFPLIKLSEAVGRVG